MSELGHRQPHHPQQSAMMAGPDGVVYVVTSAGAVPSAHATVPPRREPTSGAPDSPHSTDRDAGEALSSLPSMPVWACFSYSHAADLPSMPVFACFSYPHPADLPAMPVTPCFSYSHPADLPAMPVRQMPEVGPCFSY
jgi:hypothetical protein